MIDKQIGSDHPDNKIYKDIRTNIFTSIFYFFPAPNRF